MEWVCNGLLVVPEVCGVKVGEDIPYKHEERYRHQITGRAKHATAFKHSRSRRTATFVSYLLSPTKSCDQSETYQSLRSSTI